MPRPLVLGNGNLLVAYDHALSIRDFTFPFVGLLNHLSGNRVRLGLWIAGQFAWLDDPAWQRDLRYADDTLVTQAVCTHDGFGVTLTVEDCVLHRENILLRRFTVANHWDTEREARLFLSHDFNLAETDIGDTAFYHPFVEAIVHYKRDNYFLIGGRTETGGIFQYTTGIVGFKGAEGTWRDAEDGWLAMHPMEQGSVDSTVSFQANVPAKGSAVIRSWVCVGHTMNAVTHQQAVVLEQGFDTLLEQTANYWHSWSHNESAEPEMDSLPPAVAAVFRRSLLVMRTQIDNRGAILAANDSDILATARAHYSYMWPRDGALVAAALDRLGYQDITRRFFLFCREALPKDQPVLMHKYSADGSWGATWHPWVYEGHSEIPFQQDSTALVLWALWRHYERHLDLEFVEELYADFIVPTADFIVAYRDPVTHLPKPSYDLWEERRGVNTYSCGTVYGALKAAERFALLFADERATVYAQAAAELQAGIMAHLWDEGAQRYARRLLVHADGTMERDMTVDSALYALFAFGAFPADDERVVHTMRQVISRLWVQTEVGGIARYENDYYFRTSDDIARIPGNPWVICTLWAAQYTIAHAKEIRELDTALELLLWATQHAETSGVLSEQVHPLTGEPLSVSPLTWSHAEFVSTTLQYLEKRSALSAAN